MHELVEPVLTSVGTWPMVGSALWQQLDDHDPMKWAAILDAARHWALRVDTSQEARAEASRAIAGAADWATLSREIRQRTEFYAERPWLRRATR
ncbi:hypothetical protein BH09ACT7_BH09ACT7_08440 [soil metagenome]